MGNSANVTFNAAMAAVTIRSRFFRRIDEPSHIINYNITAIKYAIDLRYGAEFCKSFRTKRGSALKGAGFAWLKIKTYGRKRCSQAQVNDKKAHPGLPEKRYFVRVEL